MQIDVDFEVYKELTALRESEGDSYNSVIRRLLTMPSGMIKLSDAALMKFGVWFSNVHFPDGTMFRATYKGRSYSAEIKDGKWLGEDGMLRRSPSDAASAVCDGTNVNGWRFWHAQRPGDPSWHRLDELR